VSPLSRGNIEDKDDVLIENLSTVLFLVLGVLALSVSVFLSVNAAIVVATALQLSFGLVPMSFFAVLSGVLGLGALYLFRKRRRLRKEKENSPFYSSS